MINQTKILERLRHNVLFENINNEEFELIRTKLVERNYPAEKVILRDDGIGDCLYLIAEGRVKITKRTKYGEETLLALLHHGDCFGELELIDGRHRSSTVTAIENCTTFELNKQEFETLIKECPPFTIRLLQLLSVRLRALNYHFVKEIVTNTERSMHEFDKLKQLIEASKVLNSTLNLDKLLTIILDTALKIVDGDRGTLYLIDEEKGELWSKILRGEKIVEIRLPIGKGIAGYVAATGDTLNIVDAYLDNRFDPEFDEKTGYHTKSILCMPMKNKEGKIIGVVQLLNKIRGTFATDDEKFIDALSIHSSIAIENARLYESERQKIAMEKDILAAREVQLSLLPKTFPVIHGYDLAGTSIPAQLVGGDYFDFIPIDDQHTAICLGDVSGKGLPASLLMANLQATLRGQALPDLTPKAWIKRANNLLHHNTNADKFMTLFFSILNNKTHELCYCNAGHDHPYLFQNNSPPIRLKTGGIVVSILPDYIYQEESVMFAPGDVLVINSDGITEANNARKEMFGEKRFAAVLHANKNRSAAEIMNAILEAVKKFIGHHPQFDDMTIVVIKRNPI
ncbi:MAG: SpoIIE family protein phosphatase [Bacteroidota bacterium]